MAAGSVDAFHCSHCGAGLLPSHNFCSHCGAKVLARPPPGPSPIPVCENCAAEVDLHAAFCWKCGVPLETGAAPWMPASALEAGGSREAVWAKTAPMPEGPSDRVRGREVSGSVPPAPGTPIGLSPTHTSWSSPVVLALLIALIATGALLATVVIWNVATAGGSGPSAGYDHVTKVSVVPTYSNGTSAYLGNGVVNGCQYENCPEAVWFSADDVRFDISVPGTVNLALLQSSPPANATARVTAISSSPAGLTLAGATPMLVGPFFGTLTWTGLVISFPPTGGNYTLTVYVSAS